MFTFFRKPDRKKPNRAATRRFRFESLESRDCPTPFLSLGLEAQTTAGQNVQVEVSVSGTAPAFSVSLSGPVSDSMTINSAGTTSYVLPATELGTISGTVTDTAGDSAQATCAITDAAPQISGLAVSATGQGKQVDVTGTVHALSPSGLSVKFSGSAGLAQTSTTTDASGNFSLVTTAASLGNVSAVVTDIWGVNSPTATTTLVVQPPQINGFTAINLGNGEWEFEGSVSGRGEAGDTVQLSGLASASATVNSDGSFSVIVQIGSYPSGTEYAVATDVWGQTSNQASYTFFG